MQTSCGVFLRNTQHQWLLGHATGQAHWDIFKGLPNDLETPIQTALRELEEETGLRLTPHQLEDAGQHAYRPGKSMHLFTAVLDCDASSLRCSSIFAHRVSNVMIPEMDAFHWFDPDEARRKVVPRMRKVLDTIVEYRPSPMLR